MQNLVVRRPRIEEIDSINEFFELVIRDTFERNGIADLVETLEGEIEDKRKCLNQDIESNGEKRYFLIVTIDDMIVGSIEYGPSNDLIITCTNGELKDLVEIGTVFVHPEYQRKGVGNIMLIHIFNELKNKGIKEFCFDSGYKIAQKIWIKKFGGPEYYLKNYWGEGADHMVWRLKVSDVLE
ncbi:GNAT family N-acetyltransferase [Iocasia frigidifontis]|uniref:GNAT family N-acetyltransferase n=1 Tax=Iocasia fonsfrigidae TaxID=2682810 RepID=A0A8A7K811_9FIRM|nr:GNAT family N-acetyltransferase [Iocasia fonsfrigidae]QTL97866.1 GNAT family N-acetyltransferase [Iocasia fonsfrigidae]